jgi:PEP-CTERM motif
MLKKSAVLSAFLLASAFARPIFAEEFKIDFLPSGNPLEFIFDYDPATGTISSSSEFGWVSGGGELFQFNLNDLSAPTPPGCAGAPGIGDAQIFNCLTATTLTDPSIVFQWKVSPGAGFSSVNQVADLSLTISDAAGSLVLDSGPTFGTGQCAAGFSTCSYGGATFTGTFVVSPTPEPATAGLAMAGLGLLIAASRWRKRSSQIQD